MGDFRQVQAERDTNHIQDPLQWVPTTAIYWYFNQEVSTRAEFDLESVICEAIDNAAPICNRRVSTIHTS